VKQTLARLAASLALYAVVSAAWSWPLILDPAHTVVSGFDTWGTLWLASAADQLDGLGHTMAGGWPFGQDLGRADSLVLLWLLAALPGEIPAVIAISGLVLLGPICTALAAEKCAEAVLGARWPWSIVAGLSTAFLGIASATYVDGQVYALFNPWLPLLGWMWWRTTSPSGRWWHGVLAGLSWFLCLATTAYVGMAATVLILAGAARLRPATIRSAAVSLGAAAATALPLGVFYVAGFAGGDEMRGETSAWSSVDPLAVLSVGSTQVGTLAGWVHQLESEPHGVVAPLGFTVLALVGVAPLVLRDKAPGWRWWAALAAVGVALSLGPTLRLEPNLKGGLPWLMKPLAVPQVTALFRFPSRFLWLGGLGLGVVAARCLTELARRRPALAAPIVVACALECVLLTGTVWRTDPVRAVAPGAYAQTPADRAVLDLFPAVAGIPVDYELYQVDLSCAWAAQHRRPVAQRCLETNADVDPRARVTAALHDQLLNDHPDQTRAMLSELGFGAVVWRPDAYVANERAAVRAGLTAALGAPTATSQDGGEHLVVFQVPASTADPADAWARWIEGG
jgi:hypothetical protein